MADQVPTSGPWQTDPTLRQLMQAALAGGTAARGSQTQGQQQAWAALNQYVTQNRQRLGIPDNYYPDPRTQGQTLYDPNQNQFRDAAITGGSLAAGGYGLGAVLGGGAAPAASSTTAAGTAGVSAPAFGAPAAAATAAGAAPAAANSLMDSLKKMGTDPQTLAGIASLFAMAGGGGNSPFGDTDDLNGEVTKSLALQRGRIEQAQPVYDALVNQAYGMTPQAYRGTAPAGFKPQPEPSGPYAYQSPRFGGR